MWKSIHQIINNNHPQLQLNDSIVYSQCDFTLVQYGSSVRSELSLNDSKENGQKALEKVKNIEQIGCLTVTASAIQYLL